MVALDLERRLGMKKLVGEVARGGIAGVIGRDSA